MNRRQFLIRCGKTALALATGSGTVSLVSAYSCIVNRHEIFLPGLAPAFDGFRVALLSDFHHSPWIPASHLRSAAVLCNSLRPDLIALTGDFIHRGRQWVPSCMQALSILRAPSGIVAVLGNHDHYANASAAVHQGIGQAGFINLTNRGLTLRRGDETLTVGGTGDLWRSKQHLDRALAGVRKPGSALLLQHNPDYVETLTDERVGLVLSGHTHGGQCVLPGIGAPILPSRYGQKYAAGLWPQSL